MKKKKEEIIFPTLSPNVVGLTTEMQDLPLTDSQPAQ